MKVTLKPIPLPPLMIWPEEAQVGDVVEEMDARGARYWVTHQVPEGRSHAIVLTYDGSGAVWLADSKRLLLSRIGGMPTQSHRLGDLPIGSIVPGRKIPNPASALGYYPGLWREDHGPKNIAGQISFRRDGDGGWIWLDPNTRIAVAYEPIELEEPE